MDIPVQPRAPGELSVCARKEGAGETRGDDGLDELVKEEEEDDLVDV